MHNFNFYRESSISQKLQVGLMSQHWLVASPSKLYLSLSHSLFLVFSLFSLPLYSWFQHSLSLSLSLHVENSFWFHSLSLSLFDVLLLFQTVLFSLMILISLFYMLPSHLLFISLSPPLHLYSFCLRISFLFIYFYNKDNKKFQKLPSKCT